MGLSWLQKQILKRNPTAIEGFLFKNKDDEAMAYAIEHGYGSKLLYVRQDYCKYPSYVKKCLEGTPEIVKELANNIYFHNIPEEIRPQVIDRLIDVDFTLDNAYFIASEIQENLKLWIKTVKANPQSISRLIPISNLKIPELERGQFMSEFIGLDIPLNQLSSVDQDSDEIVKAYLNRHGYQMYPIISRELSADKTKLAKAYFFGDIDRNIQHVNDFKKAFEKKIQFLPEDERTILHSAIRTGYAVKPDDYDFLTNNSELVYNAIMQMEGEVDKELIRLIKEHDFSNQFEWTKEQQIQIGKKLYELKFDFGLGTPVSFQTKNVLLGIVEMNPLYINMCDTIYTGDTDELIQAINDSSYVVTRETPRYLFERNPDLFIRGLEQNFEEVSKNENANQYYGDPEFDKRVYEIARKNGYELDETSTYQFKHNPYLVRDAIIAGRIKDIPKALKDFEQIEVIKKDLAQYAKRNRGVDFGKFTYTIEHEVKKNSKSKPRNGDLLLRTSSDALKSNKDFILESARKYFPSIRFQKKYISSFSRRRVRRNFKIIF